MIIISGSQKNLRVREAAKKVLFLVARPLRRGGGGKGSATKEKKLF